MKNKAISLVKKSAKIAGVVCIATGAVALMTSKAAVQVILEGGRYLADSIGKIIREKDPIVEGSAAGEAPPEEVHAGEVPAGEVPAEEMPSGENPAE